MVEPEFHDVALLGHRSGAERLRATEALIDRRGLTPAMRAFMRGDSSAAVRLATEGSVGGAVDEHVLFRMIRSTDEHERAFAAQVLHHSGLLATLSRDSSARVREAVAQNLCTPIEVMQTLAADTTEAVRLAVAHDMRAAVEVTAILERDASDAVRQRARYSSEQRDVDPDYGSDAAQLGALVHRILQRSHDDVAEAIEDLAQCSIFSVRMRLASQEWMPPSALARYAQDRRESSFRIAVAHNPMAPLAVLGELVADRRYETSLIAAANAVTRDDAKANPWYFPDLVFHEHLTDYPADLLSQVAAHPATPARELGDLATHPDTRVVRAVASNPSAPADLLEKITRRHISSESIVRALAHNRVASEHILRMIHERGDYALAVAKARPTPPDILTALASHSGVAVRRAVALHPNTPPAVFESLGDDPHVRAGTTDAAFAHLADKGIDLQRVEHHNRLCARAADEVPLTAPRSVPAVARTLVRAMQTYERASVASQMIPFEGTFIQRTLADDLCPQVRHSVAGSIFVSDTVRARMARDPDEGVRQSVAQRTGDPQALDLLCADASSLVRVEIAGNLGASPSVLARLGPHLPWYGLRRLARHPSAPAAELERLAHSDDSGFRKAIAANWSADARLLEELGSDADADVREATASNPSTPAAALDRIRDSTNVEVRRLVAGHRNASKATLDELSHDDDYEVGMLVALNPDSPASALLRLAQHARPAVLQAVALHSRTPVDAWAALVCSSDPGARTLAFRHMRSTSGARVAVASGHETPADTLAALVSRREVEVRNALVANPTSPTEVLDRLASDSDRTIREALVKRAELPRSVIERLARDPAWRIRRAARSRLR